MYDATKTRVGLGVHAEKFDVFAIMMAAKDCKRNLEYSLKDLWLESMLLLAAGTVHPPSILERKP